MNNTAIAPKKSGPGCGFIVLVIIVLLILAVVFGSPYAIQMLNSLEKVELSEEQEQTVVSASGPYSFKEFSVNVTAKIPLSGGPVQGEVSGTCDGSLVGNYDGADNGSITGKMAGSCSPFFVAIPANATFTGSVNKVSKKVTIQFSGSGAGLSHSDSLTLSY